MAAATGSAAGPPVCVLGLGRSGTSLVARVLNILGVDLGAEEGMLPASEINQAGFWEQQEIMALNDEILTAFGGSYIEPPELPPGWHRDPRAEPARRRMAELVDRRFGGERRWGFKDPRTVYTLALWRDVVGEMAYVLCVRDPFEAAASHRFGWTQYDTDHFLDLWLRANASALRQTAGLPRAVVRYDEWFADPEAVVGRLLPLLRDGPATPAELDAIRAHVQPSLRHQRGDGGPLAGRGDAPVEVRAMAAALHGLADGATPAHADRLQTLGAALDRDWADRRARERETAAAAAETAEQHGREAALRRELADLSASYGDLIGRYGEQSNAHRELARRLEATAGELERTRAALARIEGSRSWRLTAPLRGGTRRVRDRLRGAPGR